LLSQLKIKGKRLIATASLMNNNLFAKATPANKKSLDGYPRESEIFVGALGQLQYWWKNYHNF